MKRLLTFLLFLMPILAMSQPQSNTVIFTFNNMVGEAAKNRKVTISYPPAPSSDSVSFITPDAITGLKTDNSGICTVQNMRVGWYVVTLMSPPSQGQWIVEIPATNGTIYANLNTITGTNNAWPPPGYAWTIPASDARYARAGDGGLTFSPQYGSQTLTNWSQIDTNILTNITASVLPSNVITQSQANVSLLGPMTLAPGQTNTASLNVWASPGILGPIQQWLTGGNTVAQMDKSGNLTATIGGWNLTDDGDNAWLQFGNYQNSRISYGESSDVVTFGGGVADIIARSFTGIGTGLSSLNGANLLSQSIGMGALGPDVIVFIESQSGTNGGGASGGVATNGGFYWNGYIYNPTVNLSQSGNVTTTNMLAGSTNTSTLHAQGLALRSEIQQTNGFVTQTVTNGLIGTASSLNASKLLSGTVPLAALPSGVTNPVVWVAAGSNATVQLSQTSTGLVATVNSTATGNGSTGGAPLSVTLPITLALSGTTNVVGMTNAAEYGALSITNLYGSTDSKYHRLNTVSGTDSIIDTNGGVFKTTGGLGGLVVYSNSVSGASNNVYTSGAFIGGKFIGDGSGLTNVSGTGGTVTNQTVLLGGLNANVSLSSSGGTNFWTVNAQGSGGTNGVNASIIYTSDWGLTNDTPLAQLQSRTPSTLGLNQHDAIQGILDQATNGGLHVVWNGRYTSTGLRIRSNTWIEMLPGCGLIQVASNNMPLIRNFNTTSNSPVDVNITITGGTLNFNGRTMSLTAAAHDGWQGGYMCGIELIGVTDFHISDCYMLIPGGFGIYGNNTYYCSIERCKFDADNITYRNSYLWDGPCHDWILRDNYFQNVGDDALAISANDGQNGAGFFASLGVTNISPYLNSGGPMKNFFIYNSTFSNCFNVFRILSSGSNIDNVVIDGVHGNLFQRIGTIDNFPEHGDWMTPPGGANGGAANIGSIVIRNFDAQVTGTGEASSPNLLSIQYANITNLTLENWTRTSYPTNNTVFLPQFVGMVGGHVYGVLDILGWKGTCPLGRPYYGQYGGVANTCGLGYAQFYIREPVNLMRVVNCQFDSVTNEDDAFPPIKIPNSSNGGGFAGTVSNLFAYGNTAQGWNTLFYIDPGCVIQTNAGYGINWAGATNFPHTAISDWASATSGFSSGGGLPTGLTFTNSNLTVAGDVTLPQSTNKLHLGSFTLNSDGSGNILDSGGFAASGPIIVGAGFSFSGNLSNGTNLPAASIVGAVAQSTHATNADNATTWNSLGTNGTVPITVASAATATSATTVNQTTFTNITVAGNSSNTNRWTYTGKGVVRTNDAWTIYENSSLNSTGISFSVVGSGNTNTFTIGTNGNVYLGSAVASGNVTAAGFTNTGLLNATSVATDVNGKLIAGNGVSSITTSNRSDTRYWRNGSISVGGGTTPQTLGMDYFLTAGTAAYESSSSSHPNDILYFTAATTNAIAAITDNNWKTYPSNYPTGQLYLDFQFALTNISNVRVWVGWTAQYSGVPTADVPNATYSQNALRFSSTNDSHWVGYFNSGVGTTTPVTNITSIVADTNWHYCSLVLSNTSATFFMDGVSISSVTGNGVITNMNIFPMISVCTLDAVQKGFRFTDLNYQQLRP